MAGMGIVEKIGRATIWRELYVRQATQVLLFVAAVPVFAVAMHLFGNKWYFFGVLYLIAWLHFGSELNAWQCPRCSKSFLRRGEYGWVLPFRMSCANCGLREGTEGNRPES
jgi:predicted RNA-binding Zn-ribbon protein involved in translation (DUF1610 family)